jgi:hypothetical protein
MCSFIDWNYNTKKPRLRDFIPNFKITVLVNITHIRSSVSNETTSTEQKKFFLKSYQLPCEEPPIFFGPQKFSIHLKQETNLNM